MYVYVIDWIIFSFLSSNTLGKISALVVCSHLFFFSIFFYYIFPQYFRQTCNSSSALFIFYLFYCEIYFLFVHLDFLWLREQFEFDSNLINNINILYGGYFFFFFCNDEQTTNWQSTISICYYFVTLTFVICKTHDKEYTIVFHLIYILSFTVTKY